MYVLRPFRNSDPPALVELWRKQAPERRLLHPMSVMLLEHFVLSKPYFDRDGLIVAERDGQLAGFVHAGFGPNESHTDVGRETGVVCMVQWADLEDAGHVRRQLIEAAEAYLRDRGAKTILAGPHPPFNPFYHGLVEVSELAGVLAPDALLHETLAELGYEAADHFFLLECDLSSLRPSVDRQQRLLNRTHEVRALLDHEFSSWWDTCTHGPIQRSAFEVIAKIGLEHCGSFIWWNVDLEGLGLTPPAVSMSRLQVPEPHRREGLATFLLAGALKQLKTNGTARVQIQVEAGNESALAFFRSFGFRDRGEGVSYRKTLA